MIRLRFPIFFGPDGDGVNIPVRVTLEGDPNAAPAAIEKVKEATEEATAATKEQTAAIEEQAAATEKLSTIQARTPSASDRAYNEDLNASAAAAMGGESKTAEEIAKEEQLAEVEQRRASILFQISEARRLEDMSLRAEIAGETEEAALVNREVMARREAVQLMRSQNLQEAEALAMGRERVAIETELAAKKEAQALADKEAAASSKIYGARGRVGSELRNFGMDSNAAAIGGLGAMGGMMAFQALEEINRKQDELRISSERASAELEKQKRIWQEMAAVATSMQDLTKLSQSVSERVSGLQEKLREAPSESGWIDAAIISAQGLAGWLEQVSAAIPGGGEIAAGLKAIGDVGTSTQRAMGDVSEQMAGMAAAGSLAEAQAKKNVEAFQEIERLPLPERIETLIDKMKELSDQQDKVDRSNAKGVQRYNELSNEIEKYSKALDKAMDASAHEQERQSRKEEYEDKMGQKVDENMRKEGEKFQKQQGARDAMKDEIAALSAEADGEEAVSKELENQLRMKHEIKALTDAGIPEAEAKSLAEQAKQMRDLVDQRKQADKDAKEAARAEEEQRKEAGKQQKIRDDDALQHAKATHNQTAQDRAEKNKFLDDQKRKMEDAKMDPSEIDTRLRQESRDYDKLHGNRLIDGRAPMAKPKSGLDDVASPSAPLDRNDTLRGGEHGPSDDFGSLGGHMQKSAPSADMQRLEKGNPQGGQGGQEQKQAADTQKQAASDQKSAAGDAKAAAEKQSGASEKMAAAAEKMNTAAEKMATAAASMASNSTGTPTDNTAATFGAVSPS
jgi:hypothetical protein